MTHEIESPCVECDMNPFNGFECQLLPACKAMAAYQIMKKGVKEISNVELELMHVEELFEHYFKIVQECVHQTAEDKGQWDEVVSVNEVISHIHAEVSELYTELSRGNDEAARTECADVILMCMSLAEQKKWDLGEAVIEKAKYNLVR